MRYIVKPKNDFSKQWLKLNVGYDSWQWHENGLIVGDRSIYALVGYMIKNGLIQDRDFEVMHFGG